MSDSGDFSTAREEAIRDAAVRRRAPEGPRAMGYCLACGEELGAGQRWCDALCRDDWEAGVRL